MRKFTFPIFIEEDEDGFYAECPTLAGCATQGDTYQEALSNIKEAIGLYIEDMEANHEKIPQPSLLPVGLQTIEISI